VRLPSSRVLGLVLAGAWALHASTKHGISLQELLWLCHVASALMAIGLLAGVHRLVAAGFLLHVGFGTVGWLLDLLATRETTPTSVLLHLLPLVIGTIEVRRNGWPRGMVLPAWLFFTSCVLLSRWVTEPSLNVNVSHAAWGPLAGLTGGIWAALALNAAFALVGFLITNAVLRRLTEPTRSLAAPAAHR
jgi:hypothetical protein